MTTTERERLLKIGVVVVVGLLLLDYFILEPVISHWSAQSEHIATLRQKVQRGRGLIALEPSIRGRWEEMQRTDLPDEVSAAEDSVFKGINRWVRESRVALTNLTPSWRTNEGYTTYEVRASANGDQASLSRLIYNLETDPLPARLEECEFSTRDKTGRLLNLTLRFSFVRLDAATDQP